MFRIAFFEPRIAGNTGSAIRLAAVSGSELHLVEPLGFDLDEPKLRRAGLDYHDLAVMTVHADLEAAYDALLPARVYAFTGKGDVLYTDIAYEPGDVLLFGPETTGLPSCADLGCLSLGRKKERHAHHTNGRTHADRRPSSTGSGAHTSAGQKRCRWQGERHLSCRSAGHRRGRRLNHGALQRPAR